MQFTCFLKGVQAVTGDSQFKQDAKQLAPTPCAWGVGVVACMFSWSLFHLLFIFAVARSRSHVPPGACQVSGNQPDSPVLSSHPENVRTPKQLAKTLVCSSYCLRYSLVAVHQLIWLWLSVSRTLMLMEWRNVWPALD